MVRPDSKLVTEPLKEERERERFSEKEREVERDEKVESVKSIILPLSTHN